MTLEFVLDLVLKALFVLTVALIVAKSMELWDWFSLFEKPAATAASVQQWLEKKERYLTFLATVVSTAPFVGLAGTITHIIKALTALSGAGVDIGVISGPIAQSLYATLWGLASAVPANVFYNLAQRRLQVLENQLQRELSDNEPTK